MLNIIKKFFSGGWVSLVSAIAEGFKMFQQNKRDDRIEEGAVAKAELESRKRDDKIIADINAGRGDKRVRDSVRKKYTR
jgi:hypothetical protein